MMRGLMVLVLLASYATAGELQFRDVELPTKLTVGYAVRLVDMNDDRRLDIAIVDSERILWLENPTWQEHVLIQGQTKKDNVCFAQADIDGDGKLEFAVGADWRPFDTKTGGTLQWIRRGAAGEKWSVHPIGEEPTVHRIQFADLDGDGKQELIVVPLMGRNTTRPLFQESGVRVLAFPIPADPVKGPWTPRVINEDTHVSHNFQVVDLDADGQPEILLVSFEGVSLLTRGKDGHWRRRHIGAGNQATSPNRGASEIKRGLLSGGRDYIATIEPWHGSQVVVYTRPDAPVPSDPTAPWLWKRHVVDEQLLWGHAVWCANLDGDADEELIIGIRDDKDANVKTLRRGVRLYDPQGTSPTEWKRIDLDAGGVAVEDLAAGDLNGDGKADIVAVGRQTHNVRIYWNETR